MTSELTSQVPEEFRAKIMLMRRPRGWDGLGSKAVRKDHCQAANAFLAELFGKRLSEPHAVLPSALGGISFQWKTHGRNAYVRVESQKPDGCFYRLMKGDTVYGEGRGDIPGVIQILAGLFSGQVFGASLAQKVRYRLFVLAEDIAEDEKPPTAAAQDRCAELLCDVADRMPEGLRLPFPRLTTSGGGDIDCVWDRGERLLSLSFSPSGAARLLKVSFNFNSPGAGTVSVVESPGVAETLASILWVTGNGSDDR